MTTERIDRASVGLRSERGPILLAVMLSVGLVAIDATILATAVPSVVEDLGGFTQFPWPRCWEYAPTYGRTRQGRSTSPDGF